MLGLFYQYLIHHHKIVLPGLGAVVVQRNPSVSNFTEHEFLPPSYDFRWDQTITNPSPGFFIWLSGKLNIPEEEAAMQVNNFVGELKRDINAGKEINWDGVGTIRRGADSGAIELEPVNTGFLFEKKVHGEKVIHEDSSHTILVGDEEKTSTEMTEILNLPERKKFTGWYAALIIGAIALLFIIIYMSVNGWTTSSVSNKNRMTPRDAPASYK